MNLVPSATLRLPVGDRDHIRGLINSPVILVEYGDYECPYCGAAYAIVKELQQSMSSRLGFVFRNFPLAKIHPHAMAAAQAAEAAGAQGSFWKMHDMLFENQKRLIRHHIIEYADKLALDCTRLLEELASGAYAKRIQEDFRSGVRSGVNGTPTFFINGVRYNGPRDVESMLVALTI